MLQVSIYSILLTAQKLVECTNLQIEPYDEYPSLICENCFASVLSFNKFQKMCRDSFDKFTKMLENKTEVESKYVLEKLVESDTITECKEFVVNQIEIKCERYEIFEPAVNDPLLATTNSLLEELEVEEPTSSRHCNKLRSKRFKKSTQKKEWAPNSQIKQVIKETDERNEANARLTKKAAKENTNSDIKLQSGDANDDSDGISANSCDDEGSLTGSDSASLEFNPETSSDLRCDICSKKFRYQHRLEAHKRRHEGQRGYSCTRENCKRTFNRLSYLQQHLNDHDGIPRTLYKCDRDNCTQSYTSKAGLRAHISKYHSDKPPKSEIHTCETCGVVFKTNASLKTHRFIHVDKAEWPLACDVEGCPRRFRYLQQLKVHKKRHAGIKNYACPHCDKRFVTVTNMRSHINHHTRERTWSCEFCPHVSTTPANLRSHIQNKHGQQASTDPTCEVKRIRPYQCSFCEKAFLTVEGKKYHEMIHTGEKPHVCDECGKKFRQPAGLKTHMRTHMKDAPRAYVCLVCGRSYFTLQSLRHHEMKHTGEKPYKCEECGISFRWPNNLTSHQRRHERDRRNKSKEAANVDAKVESNDVLKAIKL